MRMPTLQFHPRLLADLRGYSRERFFKDLGSGLTVGVVALPLAMAFAIASGLKPEAGLWTAIIAGFLISALGGSSVQIGGPAGAFIVIVYGIIERYGLANLWIATACAGVLLFVMGLFRLGNLVRYVPVSIVIGFTNGIAVLIGLSQLKDLLGLPVAKMPADFFSQVRVIGSHLGQINPYALGLGVATSLGLLIWPRLFGAESRLRQSLVESGAARIPGVNRTFATTSRVPGPIVALLSLSVLAWLLHMPVETIGTRFGGIPQSLPIFALPSFSWETVKQLVTPTVTIALLGAIESLLCARVADSLCSNPRHNPNQELMAQGIANFIVPFFGGMPATGTIARTVTNVRSGASSPVAGIVHALTIAVIVLLAAPLAANVPLAVLAGILLFVAWNMGEWREFLRLRSFSNHYRLILLGTFFITVVFDLTLALQAGIVAACLLFVRRMSSLFRVEQVQQPGQPGLPVDPERAVWQLYGALFFGAVAKMDALTEAVQAAPRLRHVELDARNLVVLDTTGLEALEGLLDLLNQRGGSLAITGLNPQPRSLLERSGLLARLDPVP